MLPLKSKSRFFYSYRLRTRERDYFLKPGYGEEKIENLFLEARLLQATQ